MGSLGLGIIAGVLGLVFAGVTTASILSKPQGSAAMQEIAKAIQEGASAFLKREYLYMAVFVAIVFAVIWVFVDADALGKMPARDVSRGVPATAIAYAIGAACSALAGIIGMNVAVRANVRTAAAVERGLNTGLRVAFSSGAVMGVTVVSIGILGVAILWIVFKDPNIVAGFGMGASTIALFARVGGGIYTKAADVGADLVGKVEQGIPEDDPRNPAVIAVTWETTLATWPAWEQTYLSRTSVPSSPPLR
jgi:K(+)-stimulated pyrophosphate-energized sodium pump